MVMQDPWLRGELGCGMDAERVLCQPKRAFMQSCGQLIRMVTIRLHLSREKGVGQLTAALLVS